MIAAILGFLLVIGVVSIFPNITGWTLGILIGHWQLILVLIAILWIVAWIVAPKHRHYCDTCKHGIWQRGRCYCEIENKQIFNIKGRAGCRSWVSRR